MFKECEVLSDDFRKCYSANNCLECSNYVGCGKEYLNNYNLIDFEFKLFKRLN